MLVSVSKKIPVFFKGLIKSEFWSFMLLLAVISAVFKIYLQPGLPYTHDGQMHLARFANYKIALREGQFPPRWGPNLLNGYGYPVFNYNYPLANIASLPFSLIKMEYELIFKILVITSFAFGIFGLNKWLRLLGVKSSLARGIGLSAYLLNPYIINLIYFRGGIGEIMAVNLLVWLLFIAEEIKQHKFSLANSKSLLLSSIIIISFLLSHNVLALFGSGVILLYALLRGLSKTDWLQLLKIFGVGVVGSLWFWLPALVEKQYTVLDGSPLSNMYLEHFPTLSQLIFSPLGFGQSYSTPVDSLSFNVGTFGVVGLLLFLVIVVVEHVKKKRQLGKVVSILATNILICILFELDITAFLWRLVPLSNYIQFPWRLSAFIAIFSATMLGLLLQVRSQLIRFIIGLVILWQLLLVARLQPSKLIKHSREYHDTFVESTSTLHENRAKTFTLSNFSDRSSAPIILTGSGSFLIDSWNGSARVYTLNLDEESIVIEPTMKFLGWKTWSNDMLLDYIDGELIAGRIAYLLPAGEYHIQTKFTQLTPARIIGNSSFVLLLSVLLVIIVKNRQPVAKNR